MKIITASPFYYHRGGLESYIFKISEIFNQKGHEIIPFSTNFYKNIPTQYDNFFADYVESNSKKHQNLFKKITIFQKMLYNFNAAKNIAKLIDFTAPDLVLGFGVQKQLSPSVFVEAKKRGILTANRLSDYSFIPPKGLLLQNGSKTCNEKISSFKNYINAITHTHLDTSGNPLIANFVYAIFLHNNFRLYVDNVDKFIVPSRFLLNSMVQADIPSPKIEYIPDFIDAQKYRPEYETLAYYVYMGRLTEEKGIIELLKAHKKVNYHKLLIIGDGPLKTKVREYISILNINAIQIDEMNGEQLERAVRNSRFVIVPSQGYDNLSNVILQAYAMGKPVVASAIGGIPEYVEDGYTGFLFDPKNLDEMADKIDFLMHNHILACHMGHYARELVVSKYNPVSHYQMLINLFKKLNKKGVGVI